MHGHLNVKYKYVVRFQFVNQQFLRTDNIG